MREIIFRSWNEIDQCFYYFTQGLYFDSLDFNNEVDAFCFKWTNAEEFTGLLDKNGNNIFEGDVLNVPERVYQKDGKLIKSENAVYFENGMFKCNNLSLCTYMNYLDLEIISNIHESLTPNK